jgi:hypothetical protein
MTKIFDVPDGLDGVKFNIDPDENRESIRRVFNHFYDLTSGGLVNIDQSGKYRVSSGVFDRKQRAGKIGFAVRSLYEPINPYLYGEARAGFRTDFWAGLLYDKAQDDLSVLWPKLGGEIITPAKKFLVSAALTCEARDVASSLVETRHQAPTPHDLLSRVDRFMKDTED